MNRDTALSLTVKIQAIWTERHWSPTRTNQWTDALQSLDEHAAETTLVRFRNSNEQCPSIAAFVTAARAITTPPTLIIEPSETYDPVAGDAAHATFNALIASAKTRKDIANACFAAAEAYSNAARTTLL